MQIVGMDVLPHFNITGRKADDLVIAFDCRAFFDGTNGDLVTGRNRIETEHLFGFDPGARRQGPGGDDHIVVWIQPQ